MLVNLSLDGVCTACHALTGVNSVLHNLGFLAPEGLQNYLRYPPFPFHAIVSYKGYFNQYL